jgi:hypothetical protein
VGGFDQAALSHLVFLVIVIVGAGTTTITIATNITSRMTKEQPRGGGMRKGLSQGGHQSCRVTVTSTTRVNNFGKCRGWIRLIVIGIASSYLGRHLIHQNNGQTVCEKENKTTRKKRITRQGRNMNDFETKKTGGPKKN